MLQFLGEVPLITGDELALLIGLTEGNSQFNEESWLHFNDSGKEIYISKKPFKHSLSWDQLNAVDSIYGNKVVTIDGSHYQLRLLRGGNTGTTGSTYTGYNTTEYQDSEWNRYMYPIHSTTHIDASNPNTSDMGTLAQYTDEQLHLHYSHGNGSFNWCQEVSGANASSRIVRGSGVVAGSYDKSAVTYTYAGWRPVLELINL